MPVKVFNTYMRYPVILLVVAEALALYLAVYTAVVIRSVVDTSSPVEFHFSLTQRHFFVVGLLLLAMLAVGLYQFDQRFNIKDVIARLIVSFGAGWLFVASVYFVVPALSLPRLVVLSAAAIAFVFIVAIRMFFIRTVDENVFRRRCIIYGSGESALKITRLRRRSDRRGFRVMAYVTPEGETEKISELDDSKPIYPDGDLSAIAAETGANEIVVALDDRRGTLPVRELMDCKLSGIKVVDLVGFFERETGKVRIDLLNPSWIIFSDGFGSSSVGDFSKNALDFTVALVGLALVWPVMLLTAIAIKIEEGLSAPVFYQQIRVGIKGDPFGVLKFRSMRIDAEADGKARWATKDDDRITAVGRFIRKTRIDELPQLFNVLKGDMSVVGPRPERPTFVKELSEAIPYYSERHTVKPGITGWAQLKYPYGSSEKDAVEKLQFDLFYVKNHGLLFDLAIILQTVEVVLFGKGAR